MPRSCPWTVIVPVMRVLCTDFSFSAPPFALMFLAMTSSSEGCPCAASAAMDPVRAKRTKETRDMRRIGASLGGTGRLIVRQDGNRGGNGGSHESRRALAGRRQSETTSGLTPRNEPVQHQKN